MADKKLARPGDLLFYRVTPESGWIAKIIAIAQMIRSEGKSPTSYSHVSVIDADMNYQLEGIWPKTRRSKIDWEEQRLELWRVKGVKAAQIMKVHSWCYNHLNRWYSFGQIFLGLFTLSNHYSCTKFIRAAFQEVNKDLAPNAGRFLGPNEFISDRIKRVK